MIAESLHSKHYPTYFALLWLVAKLGVSTWLLRLPSRSSARSPQRWSWRSGAKPTSRGPASRPGCCSDFRPSTYTWQEARLLHSGRGADPAALWNSCASRARPGIAGPQPSTRGAWLAYGGGTLAAPSSALNVAVPWLVASNIAAAIAWQAKGSSAAFLRCWALAQAIIFVLWLPALGAVLYDSKGAALEGARLGAAREMDRAVVDHRSGLSRSYLRVHHLRCAAVGRGPGLSLAIAALAAYGAWRLRRQPHALIAARLRRLCAAVTAVAGVARDAGAGAALFRLERGAVLHSRRRRHRASLRLALCGRAAGHVRARRADQSRFPITTPRPSTGAGTSRRRGLPARRSRAMSCCSILGMRITSRPAAFAETNRARPGEFGADLEAGRCGTVRAGPCARLGRLRPRGPGQDGAAG